MKKLITVLYCLLAIATAHAATRNIVPRAGGEGSIGTPGKRWASVHTDSVSVEGAMIATSSITASAFFGDGSNLTGVGGAGDPDVRFSYTGDIYSSTQSHLEGIEGIVVNSDLVIAGYDIRIGSATSDSFEIWLSSMATLNGTWGTFRKITVPATISSHTITSADGTISAGGIVKFDFAEVSDADPAGDVRFRIRN